MKKICSYLMSEKRWQQIVVDYARLRGWSVRHVRDSRCEVKGRMVGDHGSRDLPDLELVRPPRFVKVELKTDRGRLRKGQAEYLERLRQCDGIEVYLWRPRDIEQMMEVLL